MEIGSLIRIALNTGAEKLFLGEMHLRAGDMLRLKVIDVREDNRVLVDFGKFRALAEVAFPVSTGDELTVKVIDTKGQLRLTLVPAGAETAPTPAAAEPVRPFASQRLTQLRLQLEQVEDELPTEIVRQQERIAARRDEAEAFQLIHFSLPLKDAGEGARLKIGFPSRRQAATREGFRAAVLLALDRLGPTRIDLFMLERSLSLTFFVTSRTAQESVEAHAGDLKLALATLFDNVSVSVCVSEQKIADFEYEDQLPAGGRRLDVRA
jgi:hypothetical protein